MKRYNNLYNKIYDIENLRKAYKNSRKGKTFYTEVKEIDKNPDKYLYKLQDMLINKTYRTSEYDTFIKHDKRKDRKIYKLPYFPDRVCQWAIMQIIEPVFTETFVSCSHASLKGKGIHSALKETSKYMMDKKGTRYCLKIDVKKFFPSINQEILKELLRKKIKDNDLLWLLDEIIDSVPRNEGVPIGNYLSQYLANYYLTYLDHYIKEELHIKYYTRYMDDMVFFSDNKEKLWDVFYKVKDYLNNKLKLEIKDNYQIFPVGSRGLDFVGYRNFRKFVLIRKDIYKRMISKMKSFNNKKLSYSNACTICSYKGWAKWCTNGAITKKYILPLERRIKNEKVFECTQFK